jgi:hypothetical protein
MFNAIGDEGPVAASDATGARLCSGFSRGGAEFAGLPDNLLTSGSSHQH